VWLIGVKVSGIFTLEKEKSYLYNLPARGKLEQETKSHTAWLLSNYTSYYSFMAQIWSKPQLSSASDGRATCLS